MKWKDFKFYYEHMPEYMRKTKIADFNDLLTSEVKARADKHIAAWAADKAQTNGSKPDKS